MVVIESKRLFFMSGLKTGTHTLLKTFNGITIVGMHGTMSELYVKYPDKYKEICESYVKYCIVRNPWSHAVSMYFHTIDTERFYKSFRNEKKKKKYSTFESFIKENLYIPQERYTFFDKNFVYDKGIAFENLDDHLFEICRDNNIHYKKFHENKNVTRKFVFDYSYPTDYRDMYTDETLIDAVSKKSSFIINEFNYSF